LRAVLLARLLNRLREAVGAPVPVRELADLLWGDDPNGGPDDAGNTLRQMAWRLRQMGYPVWAVSKGYWHGYRFIPRFKEILDMPDALETPEQTITQLRATLKRLRAESREALYQRDQAQTRALALMGELETERGVTNDVLFALGKTLKEAGVEGVQIAVDRRKKVVTVQKSEKAKAA
jgi:hypothetical protein